jgi:2-(1,2-epoxy-1,2-dihydrophenyl)acetyl-CoA isomerase
MDMATMADVRFASSTARVGMTYVRMGLIPGDGGTYTLPRIVGTQRALDMIWTGKMINAQEMLDIGYVLAVYEPDELLPKVTEYARNIAKGPGVAVQLSKKLVYRSANIPFDEHLDMAQMAMFVAQSTEDAREGPRAFVEKREPQFKGH